MPYGTKIGIQFTKIMISAPGTGTASFSYGLDNKSFVKFGDELKMRFSLKIFTGNKFCLFNYATIATGGYVDFDWFRTDDDSETNN